MCGRTASSLGPGDVVKASRYTNRRTGRRETPRWRANPGQNYHTSYNVAPGGTTPVIVSSKHFQDFPRVQSSVEVSVDAETTQVSVDAEATCTPEDQPERVIQPMRWGLVPSWHKGELKSFDLKTSNCRSDNMLSSRIFKTPLEKGRRCVVVVDGFYEWHTGKDKKKQQPYYIYFPQKKDAETTDSNSKADDSAVTNEGREEDVAKSINCNTEGEKDDTAKKTEDEESEWTGQRLLTMAGVFDICHPKDTEGKPFYTYSVITVDSSKAMSHIHHRMPAILNTDEEVQQWLDYGDVPLKQAVDVIRPSETVVNHCVSTTVNNSRNNTPDCIKEVDPNKKPNPTGLTMWLKKDPKKSADTSKEESSNEPNPKRLKVE